MLWTISVLLRMDGSGIDRGPQWEENIFLIKAESLDEATKKAEKYGRRLENEYFSVSGEKTKWIFDSLLMSYQLESEEAIDGEVVFARHLRTSEVQSLKEKF